LDLKIADSGDFKKFANFFAKKVATFFAGIKKGLDEIVTAGFPAEAVNLAALPKRLNSYR